MSSPPWLFACIVSLIVAWSSDRTQEKVCSHKLILLLVSILTILKVLAHCWSYLHWFSRIHHQHVNTQRCCTIPCSLPPSIFLRWVCRSSRIINLSKIPTNIKIRYIVFYSWISSTFPRPPAKRAVAIALINAFAQLGNIAGSYVWGLKENGYRKSYGIVTAMFGCTIVGALVLRMMLSRLNKRLEELERAETEAHEAEKAREAQTDEALRVQKGFRYLV